MTQMQNSKWVNWRQVGIATAAQNFATGLAFGGFGTLVLAIEQEYGAGRAQSSLALALMVVSLSLSSWVLGRVIERVSIRKLMIVGAGLGAIAFLAASLVPSAPLLIVVYFALLGPATAMLGIVPSMTLASRWSSPDRQGFALGVVNMPVMVMLVPLVVAPLLESYGVRNVFRAMALFDLALIGLLFAVLDKPPVLATGELPTATTQRSDSENAAVTRLLLRSRAFWLVILALGIIVGAGAMKIAHMIPVLIEQGRTFNQANLLLAISGGSGILGSFAFGWLADRIGGVLALALNALVQSIMWILFISPVGMPVLIADAVVVGACGAGAQAAFGAALINLFGQRALGPALGLAALLTLPFMFGLTPLVSLIYQWSGSYQLPMGLMAGGFVVAAAVLTFLVRQEQQSKRARVASLPA